MAATVPQFCLRCRRANPVDAVYCYFDGVALKNDQTAQFGTTLLGREFTFPSGTRCRTFDELFRACAKEWGAACSLLQQGHFKQFFASVGRMDLAQQADRSASQVDLDLGLDALINHCPGGDAIKPALELAPRRIHLGSIKPGEARDLLLILKNRGGRLLHGTVAVRYGSWIRLGKDGGGRNDANVRFPFKTTSQTECPIHIETKGLPAGENYTTTLVIISNGGAIEVPVSFNLAIEPYALVPFQKAHTTRELAALMKEHTQEAAEQLSRGEVERWYQKNGWTFPVAESVAPGIAGVQQYYEAVGLSRPPRITLSTTEVSLQGDVHSETIGEVALTTSEKKWLYCHVSGEKDWLQPVTPMVSGGQSAIVRFKVNGYGLAPGQIYQSSLLLTCNGGQKHQVKVNVKVADAPNAWKSAVRIGLAGVIFGILFRLLTWLPDSVARMGTLAEYTLLFCLIAAPMLTLFLFWWMSQNRSEAKPWAVLLTAGMLGILGATHWAVFIRSLESGLLNRLWALERESWLWPIRAIFLWGFIGGGLGLCVAYSSRAGSRFMHRISHWGLRITEQMGIRPGGHPGKG